MCNVHVHTVHSMDIHVHVCDHNYLHKPPTLLAMLFLIIGPYSQGMTPLSIFDSYDKQGPLQVHVHVHVSFELVLQM